VVSANDGSAQFLAVTVTVLAIYGYFVLSLRLSYAARSIVFVSLLKIETGQTEGEGSRLIPSTIRPKHARNSSGGNNNENENRSQGRQLKLFCGMDSE